MGDLAGVAVTAGPGLGRVVGTLTRLTLDDVVATTRYRTCGEWIEINKIKHLAKIHHKAFCTLAYE